jgi:septal ring factor EnvC (AmiA/AmiB activator)
MDEMIVYVMFGGLSLFMFFLFFYVLKVERVIDRKLTGIELSLEELNKELYMISKEVQKVKELKKIEKIIEKIIEDLKLIDEKNKKIYKHLKEEIAQISQEVKKSKIPEFSNITRHEEEKIINMYKSGYNVEEISRELRIPAGEIELILKFANIV